MPVELHFKRRKEVLIIDVDFDFVFKELRSWKDSSGWMHLSSGVAIQKRELAYIKEVTK